jgi:MFS family permease
MHGRRAFAAAAAAGLLVSLFAPWYREIVVAPGLSGLRTLSLTRSGWQAFSATEVLVLVVAALAMLVVIGMPRNDPEQDMPDRLRLSGAVVAALGALAFAVVLVRLTTSPGTTKHALDETMVAIRWGMFLALVCSAALAAAGLRLIRPQRRLVRAPRPDRAPRSDRTRPSAARTEGRGSSAAAPNRRPDRTRPTRHDRPRSDDQASSWLDLPD